MKLKIILSLLFSQLSLIPFFQAQSFAMHTDTQIAQSNKLITDMFFYLNKIWADQGKSLSHEMTKKYFNPNTTLIINGKTVYTGYAELESHFKAVSKKLQGKIRFPLLEMIALDNKVVVHFEEDIITNTGNSYSANVIAIFTLENSKIQRWEEVVNSKFFCERAANHIVYTK